MRVDQHGIDAGAAEHGGCERARETAACDDNIGVPQLHLLKTSMSIRENAQGTIKPVA